MINYPNFANFTRPTATMHRYHIIIIITIQSFPSHREYNIVLTYYYYTYNMAFLRLSF